MNLDREMSLIEAVLFLESDPVEAKAIASISKLSRDVVLQCISELQNRYQRPESGIEITEIGGGFLLAPKPELWRSLQNRYGKRNENLLSRAALETLSIIAYSQPITRSEIETIRGVSADGMVRLLQQKDLIRTVGKKESPGRPLQYGTTREFLKLFRLSSIADLPRLDEVNQERFALDEQ